MSYNIKLIVLFTAIISLIYGDVAPIKRYRPLVPISNSLTTGRILSGTNAAAGQFPWQVAIEARKTGYISLCGGSLITSNAVLTAGHCCKHFTTFKIDLGSIYVNSPLLSRNVDISKVVFHPRYNEDNMNYDAAILKLDQDVSFGGTIQPVALPRLSQAIDDLFYDSTLTVSGWGRTETGNQVNHLQYTNLTIIKKSECKLYFGSQTIIESTICATDLENGKSIPCNGDSGGPAVVLQNNSWMLLGITSFSSNCQAVFPTGFVNVSFLLNWISAVTGIPIEKFM